MITTEEYLSSVKLSLLEAGGVDNWTYYSDSIQDFCDNNEIDYDDLSDELKLEALIQGGVDNWSGYDFSLEGFSEYEEYIEECMEKEINFVSFYEFEELLEKRRLEEKKKLDELKRIEAENERVRIEEEERKKFEEIDSLEFPDLYKLILNIYPNEECNTIYKKIIKDSDLFVAHQFPKHFTKAKDYALARNDKVTGFMKDSRKEYIRSLIADGLMDSFIFSNSGVTGTIHVTELNLKTKAISQFTCEQSDGTSLGKPFLNNSSTLRINSPIASARYEKIIKDAEKVLFSSSTARVKEEAIHILLSEEQQKTLYRQEDRKDLLTVLTLIRANAKLASSIRPTVELTVPISFITGDDTVKEAIKMFAEALFPSVELENGALTLKY